MPLVRPDPRVPEPPWWWGWPLSGLLGGALAGGGDALVAIVKGIGGLGAGRALRLVFIAATLVALAGLVFGSLIALVNQFSRRILS